MKINQSQKSIPVGWKICKASDCIDVRDGTHATPKPVAEGVPLITSKNIVNGDLNLLDSYNVSHDDAREINKRSRVVVGDILISMIGTVGEAAIIKKEPNFVVKNVGIFKAGSKEVLSSFLIKQFHSTYLQNKIRSLSSGGIQKFISLGQLRKLPILITSLPEQNRIVSVLETWDKAIEKLKKKIEAKKQIKKGLMQDLLTGKKRVQGFSDKWEVVELNDVSKMGSGGTPKSTNESFYGGDIPWVSIADMTANGKYLYSTLKNLSKEGLDNSSAKIYPKGTILYAMYASIGECSIAGTEMSSSQAILGIIPDNAKLDAMFLYYYLVSIKEKIKLQGQQGTQSNLNAGMVKEFIINLPPVKEQKEIIEIIDTADKEIVGLVKKLEILKEQKRYLLNNLITGTIRTPETLSTKLIK